MDTFRATLTIYGQPITKKNSQRLVYAKGRIIPIPSAAYKLYEKSAMAQLLGQIGEPEIEYAVNLECKYFMPTHRRVDLCNLLEATQDILVTAHVLKDDNCNIVARVDGSEVLYDKQNPRVEITLTEILPFE